MIEGFPGLFEETQQAPCAGLYKFERQSAKPDPGNPGGAVYGHTHPTGLPCPGLRRSAIRRPRFLDLLHAALGQKSQRSAPVAGGGKFYAKTALAQDTWIFSIAAGMLSHTVISLTIFLT